MTTTRAPYRLVPRPVRRRPCQHPTTDEHAAALHEVECAVIGAALYAPATATRVLGDLTPGELASPALQHVLITLREHLATDPAALDLPALAHTLTTRTPGPDGSWPGYLAHLARSGCVPEAATAHRARIRHAAILRALATHARHLHAITTDPALDPPAAYLAAARIARAVLDLTNPHRTTRRAA